MGNTSPKSKIRKVTKITSTTNFKTGIVIVEKSLSNEKEKSITTAICKKLLATNIVANSFFGLDNNWFMIAYLEGFFWPKSSKSFWDKEKKATSVAAIIAVQKSKTKIPIIPKIKLVSTVETELILGSGSKFKRIS